MKEDKIIKIAAAGFIGLVVAPIVLDVAVGTISLAVRGISKITNDIKFNRKIKKGLKDGSIVEIDGKYYNVIAEDVEEA